MRPKRKKENPSCRKSFRSRSRIEREGLSTHPGSMTVYGLSQIKDPIVHIPFPMPNPVSSCKVSTSSSISPSMPRWARDDGGDTAENVGLITIVSGRWCDEEALVNVVDGEEATALGMVY